MAGGGKGQLTLSFLGQESGFGYVSSNSRRGCQGKNIPGWKRRLIALSWTAGKVMLAGQKDENVLAIKVKELVSWHREPRAPRRAQLGQGTGSPVTPEVTSKQSPRTRLAGEQGREAGRGMDELGAGRQLLP